MLSKLSLLLSYHVILCLLIWYKKCWYYLLTQCDSFGVLWLDMCRNMKFLCVCAHFMNLWWFIPQEHLSLKKYIVDIMTDTTVTPETNQDGEERQKARKKAKKLRARMNSRWLSFFFFFFPLSLFCLCTVSLSLSFSLVLCLSFSLLLLASCCFSHAWQSLIWL